MMKREEKSRSWTPAACCIWSVLHLSIRFFFFFHQYNRISCSCVIEGEGEALFHWPQGEALTHVQMIVSNNHHRFYHVHRGEKVFGADTLSSSTKKKTKQTNLEDFLTPTLFMYHDRLESSPAVTEPSSLHSSTSGLVLCYLRFTNITAGALF